MYGKLVGMSKLNNPNKFEEQLERHQYGWRIIHEILLHEDCREQE